jgi:YVTN family beta-propeller protein
VASDLRIGGEILGYRLEETVGRGGMGVVYRAYDLRLKRSVALKLVAPELSEDERFRERFLAETELAASLEHPNVVPVYDAGEVDGQLYLAMRYVEGSDLKALLSRERRLEPDRAIAICDQIAAALDAAHARGLVHRDVKPSNVLLDAHEHVYLADFGLSRRLDEPGMPVGPGLSLGTPAYAAPEQIQGGEEVNGRADVYSLGCVLYECLSGEVPFKRDSELAVLWAHIQEPPPRASEAAPGLPLAVDAVLAAAMAKKADDRTTRCSDLVVAAREALGLHRPIARRDRRALVLTATGVAVVVAAVLAGVLLSQGSDQPGRPSTKPTLTPKVDSLQRIDPKTNSLVATLDVGSEPTGVAVGDDAVWAIQQGENRIAKIDPRTNSVVATGSAPGPKSVAVGGGSVWVVNADGTVTQLDAATGTSVHTVDMPSKAALAELVAYGAGAAWALSPLKSAVARINPLSGSVAKVIPLAVVPDASRAIATGDRAVWVTSSNTLTGDYRLSRIDPASNRLVDTVTLDLGAQGLAVLGGSIWVANNLGRTVSRVSASTDRLVGRIHVGKDPVAVATGDGAVWVANARDGTVSRVDPARNRVVATIPVGPNPDSVAVGPGGVWVTVHVR